MNYKLPNILFIGDLHLPYSKVDYLDFCNDIKKKYNCTKIISCGDIFDLAGISYHEKEMGSLSIDKEIELNIQKIKNWIKVFPKLEITYGNHDLLILRKAKTHGLSKKFFKTLNEIFHLPKTWKWYDEINLNNNIKIIHGIGYSGKYPHVTAITNNRCSIIMGHCHSVFGVRWDCTKHDRIFGMCVGSGVDDKQIAFKYAKYNAKRSIIGCGILLENGTLPITIPMNL